MKTIIKVTQGTDVVSVSNTQIHLHVVNRVKSGICAIDSCEKGQQVHSAEASGQAMI